jgi:hypothetical protein
MDHVRVIKHRRWSVTHRNKATRAFERGRGPDELGSLKKSGPGHFLWVPQDGPSFVDRELGTPLPGGWTSAIHVGK